MRRFLLPFVLVSLVSTLLAAPPVVPHPDQLDALSAKMQKIVDDRGVSGVVCVVGRKDGIIHESAIGLRDIAAKAPMQKDTLFRIASMTKPITAIGIMILMDEGKLNPDDDVTKHLPEFTGQMLIVDKSKDATTLKKPSRPIKLRDLLTHTSGVSGYPVGVNDVYKKRNRTLAETALATALQPLKFEPGTKSDYSNAGMDTLGRVIEVVSGESYESFLKKRIFDPLGMNDTTFYPSQSQLARLAAVYGKNKDGCLIEVTNTFMDFPANPKHPFPSGGLVSCGADLAKLYRMMLNKGELDGKRILSEKAVAEMTQVQTHELKAKLGSEAFGFGWAVLREPVGATAMLSPGSYGHGGAFGTNVWIDPKQDLFVILLIQRNGNDANTAIRRALHECAVEAIKK